MSEFTTSEEAALRPYFTNLDRPVFALRNLPEVVKGAAFSRYSRTEKSLRRVVLEEFINSLEAGFAAAAHHGAGDDDAAGAAVATSRAEDFYDRVLVGYGDDSVAELAGAHVAVEEVSMLAAKALEDSRIGISPLEKSTRYVRFDRPGVDGGYRYHRSAELAPGYEGACDDLFRTYSECVAPLTDMVRTRYPIEDGESERAWKASTRARALDLLRGLLPASALTNLGLFGNGRAFEYLITKLASSELGECRALAPELQRELSQVIPSFVKRALDDRYGQPSAQRLGRSREALSRLAPAGSITDEGPAVRLVEHDRDAERKVVAAAVFPYTGQSLEDLQARQLDSKAVLDAMAAERTNRRQKLPRALEHATYLFEITANFGAYRDLHRHRALTQERQYLTPALGYDLPAQLQEFGFADRFKAAVDNAVSVWHRLSEESGVAAAQYVVPMAFRVRWYFRLNLRELIHLCELRTQPQGHPDYRCVAQEMFRRVQEVHPRLASVATFVDLGPGDELERRQSERRLDEKMQALAAKEQPSG